MEGWHDFLLTEAAAAAVLTGLIFVAVSINLSRILSLPRLPPRALQSIVILMTIFVVSSVLLVPEQPIEVIGSEVLVCGVIAWLIVMRLDLMIQRATDRQYRQSYRVLIVLNQVAIVPYIIAGGYILLYGLDGVYVLVLATLISAIKALIDAWVLLVEINR
jgi:modulator of FtsH protease